MTNRPLQRLMFLGGIALAVVGVFFASRSASTLDDWRSIVSILVIMAGAATALVGLFLVIDRSAEMTGEVAGRDRVLPSRFLPVVYGGFILIGTIVPALVVGYYETRSAGLQTGIFAFIIFNALFGLGLALAKKPTYI